MVGLDVCCLWPHSIYQGHAQNEMTLDNEIHISGPSSSVYQGHTQDEI